VEPRDEGISLRERVLAIALAEPLVKEAHDITVFEQGGSVSVSLHLKFPPEVELREAHETAERVERAIRGRPGVRDVQTHLEPLERLLATATSGARSEQQSATEVARLIRELTGREAERVKVMSTDVGLVVFLSVAVDPSESLAAAHQLASELEEEIHRRIGGIAEVVVHTEPSARTGSPAAGEGFAPSGI
jgi:divalent metal cation (Fe/Co/Zn/Cd) transporter